MINANFMQQISCNVNLAHISKEVTLRYNRKNDKFQCKCANTPAILEKIASRNEEKWMSSCEKKNKTNTCEDKECDMIRQSSRIGTMKLIKTTFDDDLTHLYQLVYFLLSIEAVACLFFSHVNVSNISNEIRKFVSIFTSLDGGVFALWLCSVSMNFVWFRVVNMYLSMTYVFFRYFFIKAD